MSTATEVVIGGCSAGGLGIFMGLDQMADIVTATAKEAGNEYVKVRGLSDSGFFMEHTSSYRAKITHNSYGKDDAVTANSVRHNRGQYFMDYASCMRDLFNYMNLTAGVNQDCIEAQRRLVSQGTVSNTSSFGIESNCVFAAHLVPHIKTPLFLLQPQYDYWQILHIFSQAYTSPEVNTYGRGVVKKLKMSLFHAQHPGHGVFIDSCAHHCTSCSDETENTWSGNHIRSTISMNMSVVSADGALGQKLAEVVAESKADVTASQESSLRRRLSSTPPELPTHVAMSSEAEHFHWNEAESFAVWYQHSLEQPQGGAPITPGVNWFFQDRPYPCGDCCSCSTDMIGRLRKVHPL